MVRVRFAPSPTGFLHLGSLRTALYDFLLARKQGGSFILRIEDTDAQRKVEGALEGLIKVLEQMGLDYDEGLMLERSSDSQTVKIIEKGKYGPYVQSKRLHLYQKYAQKLIDSGRAYYCFCAKEELEDSRKKQMADGLAAAYDRRCRKLSPEEIRKKIEQKIPYVIRLKVPSEGKIKFNDLIRGEVEFDLKNVDDQVLLKSDGFPTYHLAVVIDDYLMKISHVIRGEEWLPSVPKHILIYQALDWPLPKFAHLPLILNPDRSKLSKRQGDVAVEDYLAQGYLPEALINFIALLGWSPQGRSASGGNPGDDQEIFSLKELIKKFSIDKIQKSGAVFNREKLDWMNGYYIRKMRIDELTKRCLPYLIQAGLINSPISNFQFPISKQISKSKIQISETKEIITFDWLKKIVALEQERMKKLADLPEAVDFFFKKEINYDSQILIWKKTSTEKTVENLFLVKETFKDIDDFKTKDIQKNLEKLAEKQGAGEIFWPVRTALSGRKNSPPPAEIAEILGKEKFLTRLDLAINKLK